MNKNVFGRHTTDTINKNPIKNFIYSNSKTKIVLLIAALLLYFAYSTDKTRILYCDKVQDYCEIRTESYLGQNKKIPICAPSTIIQVKSEINLKSEIFKRLKNLVSSTRRNKKYYISEYTLYAVDNSGKKTELYSNGQYERRHHEYQFRGDKRAEIRSLMEKHARKINEMLKNKEPIIEYRIK